MVDEENKLDSNAGVFRKTQFTYFKKYDNLKVRLVLINGQEFVGKVHMKLNDNYDFELELDSGERIFFMKHSVLYLSSMPKEEEKV